MCPTERFLIRERKIPRLIRIARKGEKRLLEERSPTSFSTPEGEEKRKGGRKFPRNSSAERGEDLRLLILIEKVYEGSKKRGEKKNRKRKGKEPGSANSSSYRKPPQKKITPGIGLGREGGGGALLPLSA